MSPKNVFREVKRTRERKTSKRTCILKYRLCISNKRTRVNKDEMSECVTEHYMN